MFPMIYTLKNISMELIYLHTQDYLQGNNVSYNLHTQEYILRPNMFPMTYLLKNVSMEQICFLLFAYSRI